MRLFHIYYCASNNEDDLEEINKKIEKHTKRIEKHTKKYEFWISKRNKFLEKKRNAKLKSEKSEEN